ncbi:hypothetical protein D9M73_155230 [compost metagenome]
MRNTSARDRCFALRICSHTRCAVSGQPALRVAAPRAISGSASSTQAVSACQASLTLAQSSSASMRSRRGSSWASGNSARASFSRALSRLCNCRSAWPCQFSCTRPSISASCCESSRKRSARSRSRASRAFICVVVRPRNRPSLPGRRARNQLAPTSGYRPMFISGIDSRLDGVTMRMPEPCIRPMPPPIT